VGGRRKWREEGREVGGLGVERAVAVSSLIVVVERVLVLHCTVVGRQVLVAC